MSKLLIGIPSFDYMHADFVKSLLALTTRLHSDGIAHDVWVCNGTLAHVARDRVACKAINEGYDRVLWLDADMLFSEQIYDDLSFSGHSFVTALAASRRPPFNLCIFKAVSEERGCECYTLDSMPSKTEAFRIQGCGFAGVLIQTEILRAVQMHYGTCFLPMSIFGEDLAFCHRARAMGYEIWAEPTVRMGHIGHNAIWPGDQETYLATLQRG